MFIIRNISKLLASLFFVALVTFTFLQNTTEAVSIKVQNVHSKNLSVAVVYYDAEVSKWRTRGWYIVSPNSVRTLNFTTGNSNKVYLHAYLGNTKWGKGDITRTVITEAFSYYDKSSCPQGSNRRTASFSLYNISNGVVNYKPTLKS